MSKFKVGDTVRRISVLGGHSNAGDYNGMKVGDMDEVVGYEFGLILKKFGRGHGESNFELVTVAEAYKPGDRVKRLNYPQGNFEVGQVGIVKAFDQALKRVILEDDKPDFCHDPANLVAVESRRFQVGDKVRRKVGRGANGGVAEGEVFEVTGLRPNGWVYGRNLDVFGHNPAYLELVAEAPVIETVTSVYVAKGQFLTTDNAAVIRWEESDDEQRIEVNIPDQECTTNDLRQIAKVILELADKLAATKR